jgi:hypothetical protein
MPGLEKVVDPGSGAGKVIKFLPVVFLENRELCSGPWGPLPGSTNFSNFDGPGIMISYKSHHSLITLEDLLKKWTLEMLAV